MGSLRCIGPLDLDQVEQHLLDLAQDAAVPQNVDVAAQEAQAADDVPAEPLPQQIGITETQGKYVDRQCLILSGGDGEYTSVDTDFFKTDLMHQGVRDGVWTRDAPPKAPHEPDAPPLHSSNPKGTK
eukprot:1634640-Amphidinium_carterae.1